MRGKGRKDAARDAAVAAFAAVAEDRVRFIHDHDHRPERADRHEDARLLPLGVADPFAAELAELHHGQAALAGKAIDEKRFPDADAARHEDAALEHVGLAVANQPRQLAQLLFRGIMRRHEIE